MFSHWLKVRKYESKPCMQIYLEHVHRVGSLYSASLEPRLWCYCSSVIGFFLYEALPSVCMRAVEIWLFYCLSKPGGNSQTPGPGSLTPTPREAVVYRGPTVNNCDSKDENRGPQISRQLLSSTPKFWRYWSSTLLRVTCRVLWWGNFFSQMI